LLITSWIIWTCTILVGIPTVREHRDPGKRYNRLTTRSQLWLDPKRWCPKWTYIYAFIWVCLASQGICIGTYGSKDHTIVTCISSQDSLRLTWSTRFSHLYMPRTYPKVPAALYEAGNTRGGGVLDMHMCKLINLPTQLCVHTINIYTHNSFGGLQPSEKLPGSRETLAN
jgi:hypothetical protein